MPSAAGQPQSLTDEAYQLLRRQVLDCELLPGQWLSERQVSADIGIGLSPVRGALARLDHEGLVIIAPRRGYKVAPLTIKGVEELFQAWRIIGPAIARQAALNMTPADMKRYRAIIGRRPGKLSTAREMARRLGLADERFELLCQVAGNSIMTEIYRKLAGDQRRVFSFVHVTDPGSLSFLDEPADVEEAYASNDGETAARAVTDFIDRARAAIIGALQLSATVLSTELVPPADRIRRIG